LCLLCSYPGQHSTVCPDRARTGVTPLLSIVLNSSFDINKSLIICSFILGLEIEQKYKLVE